MELKIDYKKLKQAIKRSPQRVAKESKVFLYRASNELERNAGQSPWKVGRSGGGVPVATGNLLRSHKSKIEPFKLTYYQDERKADYGKYIHPKRPWLTWVQMKSASKINNDAEKMLKNIVEDLGN